MQTDKRILDIDIQSEPFDRRAPRIVMALALAVVLLGALSCDAHATDPAIKCEAGKLKPARPMPDGLV